MNTEIINRYNSVVSDDDAVYILGDLILGPDLENGIELINRLKGTKFIIAGNHDTEKRRMAYVKLSPIVTDAMTLKYCGYTFYLSHYPSITDNFGTKSLKQCVCNLYGHTHQKSRFYEERPWMYNVGVDSHNYFPVDIDTIIFDMQQKVLECNSFL